MTKENKSEDVENEKFTFRQRWFPTLDDAEELYKKRCERKGKNVGFSDFPVRDLIGRWARTILVAGALSWGIFQGIGNNYEYSKGTRTGMINKFAEKGLIWKTYEG